MPGYNSQRRGTARIVPIYFCVVLCIVFLCCSMHCLFFLSFCVLFVCKCVLYSCHRVSTQLQLTNISNLHTSKTVRIVLSSVTCLALPYFFTLFHKRHDFRRKKIIKHEICVLILPQLSSEIFLIMRKIPRDLNLHRS
jgi:hypothetical protein